MGEIRVDGRDGPRVGGAEEMAGRFHGELIAVLPNWKERLHSDPDRLVEVEQEGNRSRVQQSIARDAGGR